MEEDRLLRVVHQVQQRLGKTLAPTLPGLFAAAARFVSVLPELDLYHDFRREPVVGPFSPLSPPLPLPERPAFFAYLHAKMPGCEAILTSLARTGCPGRTYVLGANPGDRDRLRRLGLEVFDQPVPMRQMIA